MERQGGAQRGLGVARVAVQQLGAPQHRLGVGPVRVAHHHPGEPLLGGRERPARHLDRGQLEVRGVVAGAQRERRAVALAGLVERATGAPDAPQRQVQIGVVGLQ